MNNTRLNDHFHSLIKTLIRLYGCLRIAVGYILFHVRGVDNGRFRRSVCEGLGLCYFLQAIAVLRAQFTDQGNW